MQCLLSSRTEHLTKMIETCSKNLPSFSICVRFLKKLIQSFGSYRKLSFKAYKWRAKRKKKVKTKQQQTEGQSAQLGYITLVTNYQQIVKWSQICWLPGSPSRNHFLPYPSPPTKSQKLGSSNEQEKALHCKFFVPHLQFKSFLHYIASKCLNLILVEASLLTWHL